MLSRASGKQRWVLKQGLNHANSRIRDSWKRWVLKQGLNYVEAPIREAAAQAHAESPPSPKTHSWTAAFVLKQGLNHAKSRISDAWKTWVLKQGLNYVKSRIRQAGVGVEAIAHAAKGERQSHPATAAVRGRDPGPTSGALSWLT